jgi:hypothetical protein
MRPRVARVSLALTLALATSAAGICTASAQVMQSPSPCEGFVPLRTDAQHKGMAIAAAEKRHADPKDMCSVVSVFSAAEEKAVKFLEDNKTWCGIPEAAVASAKALHEKTLKFREMVCNAATVAQRRVPTLADALGEPTLDTSKNTKTNTGTFNTLTGNPLAK